jgi:hypothetical protein
MKLLVERRLHTRQDCGVTAMLQFTGYPGRRPQSRRVVEFSSIAYVPPASPRRLFLGPNQYTTVDHRPYMLVALVILGATRASPISRDVSPPITASQAASCDDPDGCRTLWNIFWSCLFTILLCTWVSVHPNIPSPREKWLEIAFRRFGIMLAALIVPECIIAWAIRQRMLASHLADTYSKGD